MFELDAAQYERAITVLGIEQQANILSSTQKRMYWILSLLVWSCICCAIIFFGYLLVVPKPSEGQLRHFELILKFGASAGALACLLVLLLLPLFKKSWRQIKLVRRLGLAQVMNQPYQRWSQNSIVFFIPFVLGVVVGLFIVVVGFVSSDVYLMAAGATLGSVLIAFQFLRLLKQRLETLTDIKRLRSSLDEYREAAESGSAQGINYPMNDFRRIARYERDQIARQRADVITRIRKKGSEPRSVVKSSRFQEEVRRLQGGVRLRIEDEIERLSHEPQLAGVGGRTMISPVRDIGFELVYEIDSAANRLRILEVRPTSAGGTEETA